MAKKGIFNSKGVAELPMQNGGAVGEKKECCWCAKRGAFSPFCCDKLIKWNVKCVIFRVRKEAKKTKKRFNIVEFSIKGILMFVNENERNRVENKPINSKIKLK